MKKGAANVAEIGTAACNSRAVQITHGDAKSVRRWVTTDAMVNHAQSMLCRMKSALESSVRSNHSSTATNMQPEPGRYISVALGAPEMGASRALTRVGERPALSGYSRPPNASRVRLRNTRTSI
jgi:hypothetical protein